ncbi:MAG: hypothetical protein KAS47_00605 [Candidatus Heimdallarchaeota archaeon]|nr:hypothetical protein [Candidatus Heimdallarchaeota archaeon]
MDEFSQEIEDFVPEYLSSLEESVLEELSIREKHTSLRFNGLRRLLKDVHQQKLTRALERLQEDSLIKQFPDGGYGLGNESYEKVRQYFGKDGLMYRYQDKNSNPEKVLASLTSNKEIPVEDLVEFLTGKYFGNYRFVGHYYMNEKGRLEWIHVEDHSKILISSISPTEITIESFNVSKSTIERLIQMIRQMLVTQKIFLRLHENLPSNAN